jgi:hypothetical protein
MKASRARRHWRRWRRRLAFGAGLVLLLIGAVFAWAYLSTDTSTIARALIWMEADIGDQDRFPSRSIPAGRHESPLPVGPKTELRASRPNAEGGVTALDPVLRDADTRAFVVVHHGRVVYQRYHQGTDEHTLETSFSVAKSFVSTLVEIAIDERLIGSVDDPVTD